MSTCCRYSYSGLRCGRGATLIGPPAHSGLLLGKCHVVIGSFLFFDLVWCEKKKNYLRILGNVNMVSGMLIFWDGGLTCVQFVNHVNCIIKNFNSNSNGLNQIQSIIILIDVEKCEEIQFNT